MFWYGLTFWATVYGELNWQNVDEHVIWHIVYFIKVIGQKIMWMLVSNILCMLRVSTLPKESLDLKTIRDELGHCRELSPQRLSWQHSCHLSGQRKCIPTFEVKQAYTYSVSNYEARNNRQHMHQLEDNSWIDHENADSENERTVSAEYAEAVRSIGDNYDDLKLMSLSYKKLLKEYDFEHAASISTLRRVTRSLWCA